VSIHFILLYNYHNHNARVREKFFPAGQI